mmetsp:Transcript_51742/g.160307  ORF Transcript_51742/g.160307 Transcript_51742/m.160307 type:complete len:131 (-) Transcript_51742:343-735(-)
MGGMGGMGLMGGNMGMAGIGMGGMNGMSGMSGVSSTGVQEAMFKVALQSSMLGQVNTQLMFLLPMELLQKVLVPRGHLAEIAQRCQIHIDLGAEVPPSMRQVSFVGPVSANAMALYFLQERAAQHGGGSM